MEVNENSKYNFYQSVFDYLVEGCQIITPDWTYFYLNNTVIKQSKKTKEELLGRKMMDVFPGIENTPMFDTLRKCMQYRNADKIINEFELPNGDKEWFELSIEPVPEGLLIMSVEITRYKKAEEQINKLNRLYKVMSNTNQSIVRMRNTDELLNRVCRIAVEDGQFKMVWVGFTDPNTGNLTEHSYAGPPRETGQKISFAIDDPDWEQSSTITALISGNPMICNEINDSSNNVFWKTNDLQNGYLSIAAFPLKILGKSIGVLTLYSDIANYFDKQEISLIDEMALDISFALEFAELERQRKFSEEKYQTIVESAPNAMILVNHEGVIVSVNSQGEKMFGYNREELIGKPVEILIPEQLRDKHVLDMKNFYLNPKARIMGAGRDLLGIHKSGKEVPVEIGINPIKTPEGLFVLAAIVDISERKKSEEKLREHAALLDITTDAIIVSDKEDNLLYWNKGAEKLYGYKQEEVLGKNVNKTIYKKLTPEFQQAMNNVLKNGTWHGDLQQINKKGEEITVDSKWTLMSDHKGNPISILKVNTDITRRKLMEDQYLRNQRIESIGTLASGIAHDLNNVLTPMMMSIELLKMRINDKKGVDLIEAMSKSTQQGANLVKQLLTFSRGTEGNYSPLKIEPILNDVKKIISLSFPKNIDIIIELTEDLKTISGDGTQLNQVFMNLLVNARDAMPEGGKIKISAQNIYVDSTFALMNPEVKIGYYILLSISDNGSGIPKRIIDKIYEPFFTTKDIGKGTGLGLSTTIGIIKSHKGFINVSSIEGRGTEFKIYFPVSDIEEDVSQFNSSEEILKGNGETILLIEDEESIVEAASQTLEQYNYNILVASDGVEGLTVYLQNKEKINLVLTDFMLPFMDGHQTIKAILKINPAEKIIVMSGHEQPENIQQLSSHIKFISKPFTAKILLMALQEVLK